LTFGAFSPIYILENLAFGGFNMILPIYDFRNLLQSDIPEPLSAFIEECLLLDEEGLIEIEDDSEILVEKGV
jgi:hypothetical protein